MKRTINVNGTKVLVNLPKNFCGGYNTGISPLRSKTSKIKHALVQTKIYMHRALSYVSLVNAGMLLFIFLNTLQDKGIAINIHKYGLLIFCGTLLILVIIGYVEQRLGIHTLENSLQNKQNKELQSLLKRK